MILDFQNLSARRDFFVNYAKRKGFDPLVPDNWYRQVRKDVAAEQVSIKAKQNKTKQKQHEEYKNRRKNESKRHNNLILL